MPWVDLAAAIEPVYPKGGSRSGGRSPVPLERLLRIYFPELWFNFSDPAAEEVLYNSAAMRRFVGIDLGSEPAPDDTTICKFRHLLERNGLGKVLLKATNRYLRENGMKIGNGTIVDATRHRDGIAAYCKPDNKVALGFVEGLNSKIRVIQRRAYGLHDEGYLKLKVLTSTLPAI